MLIAIVDIRRQAYVYGIQIAVLDTWEAIVHSTMATSIIICVSNWPIRLTNNHHNGWNGCPLVFGYYNIAFGCCLLTPLICYDFPLDTLGFFCWLDQRPTEKYRQLVKFKVFTKARNGLSKVTKKSKIIWVCFDQELYHASFWFCSWSRNLLYYCLLLLSCFFVCSLLRPSKQRLTLRSLWSDLFMFIPGLCDCQKFPGLPDLLHWPLIKVNHKKKSECFESRGNS